MIEPSPIGKTRIIRKIRPYFSILSQDFFVLPVKIPDTTLKPSSGWIGIRLNIHSIMFRLINGYMYTASDVMVFDMMAASMAVKRLDNGPAKEISILSFLGFFRLKGSNMTGLPQPKPTATRKKIP